MTKNKYYIRYTSDNRDSTDTLHARNGNDPLSVSGQYRAFALHGYYRYRCAKIEKSSGFVFAQCSFCPTPTVSRYKSIHDSFRFNIILRCVNFFSGTQLLQPFMLKITHCSCCAENFLFSSLRHSFFAALPTSLAVVPPAADAFAAA